MPLSNKTIVLTGASSGIGRATALGLARLGPRLILQGRDPKRSEETLAAIAAAGGNAEVELVRGDLSTQAGLRDLAAEIAKRTDRIDVLLNNAGVTMTRRTETADGFETTFAVNHLAYFTLTGLLLPLIQRAERARIVNVASDAHRFGALDLDDLQSEKSFSAMRVYGRSKSANILFTHELAHRLAGTPITANALHPGGVRTNLGRGNGFFLDAFQRVVMLFMKSPEEGARTSIYLSHSEEVAGASGGYYARCALQEPAAHCRDAQTARRLWERSEEMVGFSYA